VWLGGFGRNLGYFSVFMSKLWGIYSALELAWDKGYRMLSLESDSAIAVSLVNKGCPSTHL
jgi:hypothetical protein